jgi:hypothetical protein
MPEPASTTSENSPLLARQPLVWLLVIVALALGLRVSKINEPLQRDEFGALYAVAERKTSSPEVPPTATDPLAPVEGLGEVSDRSVLPFGARNPVPLYHDILYFTVKALPISEWSLRLPSLLAGLGCVLGVYLLCRRLVGLEMALIAALFVAVEPTQVASSVLARPYALANLACILSFAALVGLLKSGNPATAVLMAVGYGAAVAFIGYMNPVLLLVVVAHVALVVYWAVAHREKVVQIACAGGGLALAALLLAPEFGYFARLHAFSSAHSQELSRVAPPELRGFLLHNATFMCGLLVAAVAGLVVRYQMQSGDEPGPERGDATAKAPTTTANEPDPFLAYAAARAGEPTPSAVADKPAAKPAPAEPPLPDNPDAVWLGRTWLFLPQLVALILAYSVAEPIFFTRYLSYTTLGGMVLLAYWVTRGPTHQSRLGMAFAVAAAIFCMSFISWGNGHHLTEPSSAYKLVEDINGLKSIQPGDRVLFRSSAIDADYLYDAVPAENRRHVAGALAAPLTTLYVPTLPVHVVVLSLSHASEHPFGPASSKTQARAGTGDLFNPDHFYTTQLGADLRAAPAQFWMANDAAPQWNEFMTCFLPWLARQTGHDLKVARHREGDARYFNVPNDAGPADELNGLSNSVPNDFIALDPALPRSFVRVQRQPLPLRVLTKLAAFADTAVAENVEMSVVAAWLLGSERGKQSPSK